MVHKAMLLEKSRWITDRFRSMEGGEAFSRLADIGRHMILRASLERIRPRVLRVDPSLKLPRLNNRIDHISNQDKEVIIAAANNWLDRRGSFLSLRNVPLSDALDWHRDYSSGVVAPLRYSALINPRDRSAVGDVKYIWELNRCQHLVTLGLAWCLSRNAQYWCEIEKQIASWVKSNPFMIGVNWQSPLEAAIRLLSWAYVHRLTAELEQSRELFHDVLRNSIYQHQYFISKFHSKHSSANNHLIGEMAGLYAGSVIWPRYDQSSAWRHFAKQKLIQEMERQVEPDGVSKERTTEYQMFVMELFVSAGALGNAVGDPFPDGYWWRVNRMRGFLLAISNRAGDLPMFGDGDSAQVMSVPGTGLAERVRSLLNMGQGIERTAAQYVRSLCLLWGQRPETIPIRPTPAISETIKVFPNGGYYVLAIDRGAETETLVVFDAGPLGLSPLNAHGHSDALSFWLSYGGEEFLIDPGTYCYQSGSPWRSYFRGTAAHNTIRVDGKDQSVAAGQFLWREVAHAWIDDISDTDECVQITGSHDGYERLQDPVIHRRTLRLFKRSRVLLVSDRLECQGSHQVEIVLHLSEKCRVRQAEPNCFEAFGSNKRLLIRFDPGLATQTYRGSEHPIFGWVSRAFGLKVHNFTIVARATITGSKQFTTEIAPV